MPTRVGGRGAWFRVPPNCSEVGWRLVQRHAELQRRGVRHFGGAALQVGGVAPVRAHHAALAEAAPAQACARCFHQTSLQRPCVRSFHQTSLQRQGNHARGGRQEDRRGTSKPIGKGGGSHVASARPRSVARKLPRATTSVPPATGPPTGSMPRMYACTAGEGVCARVRFRVCVGLAACMPVCVCACVARRARACVERVETMAVLSSGRWEGGEEEGGQP